MMALFSKSTFLRKFSFFLACFVMALALSMERQWLWVALALGLGVAGWYLLDKIRWQAGQAGFIILVGAAAAGIFLGLPLWLMLPAVVFALGFWDLDAFLYRIARFQSDERIERLRKAHHYRLAVTLLAGVVISLPGLFLRLDLSLGWAILLGLVIFLGIRLGIRAMGERVSDESRP